MIEPNELEQFRQTLVHALENLKSGKEDLWHDAELGKIYLQPRRDALYIEAEFNVTSGIVDFWPFPIDEGLGFGIVSVLVAMNFEKVEEFCFWGQNADCMQGGCRVLEDGNYRLEWLDGAVGQWNYVVCGDFTVRLIAWEFSR